MDKKLEQMFSRFNYRKQVLELGSVASKLASSCIDIINSDELVPDKTNLLQNMAEIGLILEQFENHFPEWASRIDQIQCDKINSILSELEEV